MSVCSEMLLHPELLTNDQLLHVIQERHLNVPNMELMHRDQLLEIFHQYCIPYGQRRYRDSGRGKILNRSRHISPEPQNNELRHNCERRKHQHPSDRLRPPPDLLSGHMKRIKIEHHDLENNKNKSKRKMMEVDSVPPATDNPPTKRARKPITWP